MRFALVLVLTAVTGFGQSKQERGKQVIGAVVDALGGPHFRGMRNRIESGRAYSFYNERISGLSIATMYVEYLQPSAPGDLHLREREAFGKDQKSGAVLLTGDSAYDITFRGVRPLPQETLDRFKDSTLHNVLYILKERLDESGLIFEYQGSEIVENVPTDKVDITDADNRVVTVFFDHSSRLPLKQIYYRLDPKTGDRNEEVTIFGKFRDVGNGVMWPFDVQRSRNGERIFQMYSETVEINQHLPGNLFALPQGAKILKPEK